MAHGTNLLSNRSQGPVSFWNARIPAPLIIIAVLSVSLNASPHRKRRPPFKFASQTFRPSPREIHFPSNLFQRSVVWHTARKLGGTAIKIVRVSLRAFVYSLGRFLLAISLVVHPRPFPDTRPRLLRARRSARSIFALACDQAKSSCARSVKSLEWTPHAFQEPVNCYYLAKHPTDWPGFQERRSVWPWKREGEDVESDRIIYWF
jgi:hypothetical protein